MHKIVKIYIVKMWESCERTTFYVELLSDEGYTRTGESHRTGSVYTNGEGLSIEEALDRALTDAADWGDFLGIDPEPYTVDGVVAVPRFKFNRYTIRRLLDARKADPSLGKGLR